MSAPKFDPSKPHEVVQPDEPKLLNPDPTGGKAPKFDPAKAFTHSFMVPERMASLRITLHGKVANLSKGGEKQDVNAGANWEVNGIDKTELTSDVTVHDRGVRRLVLLHAIIAFFYNTGIVALSINIVAGLLH